MFYLYFYDDIANPTSQYCGSKFSGFSAKIRVFRAYDKVFSIFGSKLCQKSSKYFRNFLGDFPN